MQSLDITEGEAHPKNVLHPVVSADGPLLSVSFEQVQYVHEIESNLAMVCNFVISFRREKKWRR